MCRSQAEGGRRCPGLAAWDESKRLDEGPWEQPHGKGSRRSKVQDSDSGPWPQYPMTDAERAPGFETGQRLGREMMARQRIADQRKRNAEDQDLEDLREGSAELSDKIDAATMVVRELLGLGETDGIASRRRARERAAS